MVSPAGGRRPLARAFYARETTVVARALLGAILECETADGIASGRIVETEAYLGPPDPASHAVAGLTARTRHLFGVPGTAYVYFVYGMHWCVNAVTGGRGSGTAVLIRALEPVQGILLMRRRRGRVGARTDEPAPEGSLNGAPSRRDRELTNGPGKLCAALGIDGRLSGLSLHRPPLVIRPGPAVSDDQVLMSPRIGLTRAAEAPRRYFLRDNPFVSPTPSRFRIAAFEAASAAR